MGSIYDPAAAMADRNETQFKHPAQLNCQLDVCPSKKQLLNYTVGRQWQTPPPLSVLQVPGNLTPQYDINTAILLAPLCVVIVSDWSGVGETGSR